ncbi:MAG: RNA polymerase sigma factor [Sandaracinaceae bacterium]
MSAGLEDRALLDAWRDGDMDAGNTLFERHFDALYRFFRHKNVDDDAMDLLQRTLLACVEGLQRFEGHSSVRTYLFAIARHKLHDYWRARSKQAVVDFGVSSLLDLGPSPSSVFRAGERQRLLLEALRRLPLDQQIAVELHYFEGMTGPDLASVLATPEGTVRGRLHRARARLRELVEELAVDARELPASDADFDVWARSQSPNRLD